MILQFKNKTQKERDALIGKAYFFIMECSTKNLDIEIREVKQKKTYEQIKAAYKLFELCQPHFVKWKPASEWSIEQIKEFMKSELGYMRKPTKFEIAMMIKQSGFIPKTNNEKLKMIKFCKKIKQNISFADFTKEQFCSFLEETQVWAQTEIKEINKSAWLDVYIEKQSDI